MGSRSRGGYKDDDHRQAALEMVAEQRFPRPPKKLVVSGKRSHKRKRRRRRGSGLDSDRGDRDNGTW